MVVILSLCSAVHGRNKGQEKAYELGWFMMACFVLGSERGVASLGWELGGGGGGGVSLAIVQPDRTA